ncbi:MAG: helix-turn-helix domain-containing protein [Planctomycetota bacterium]
MSERLIRLNEAADRLGISRRSFYRLRARLVARGLQEVRVGCQRRYREQSLDRIIQDASEKGTSL